VAEDLRKLTNVSAVQFQAAQPPRADRRIPWYVYVAAILLIGWASVVLSAWIFTQEFDRLFWRAMIPVGLELATGAGSSSIDGGGGSWAS
jgi:hypothetical protein